MHFEYFLTCLLIYELSLQDVPEFELHFDKVYKWVASSIAEKNAFILSLWKVILHSELQQ